MNPKQLLMVLFSAILLMSASDCRDSQTQSQEQQTGENEEKGIKCIKFKKRKAKDCIHVGDLPVDTSAVATIDTSAKGIKAQWTVTVIVKDKVEDGHPVQNAMVTLTCTDYQQTKYSNANGRVDFKGDDPCPCTGANNHTITTVFPVGSCDPNDIAVLTIQNVVKAAYDAYCP